jgi:hypothetical protein
MALLRIPEQDRTLTESGEIAAYLSERGIDYERLEGAVPRRLRPRRCSRRTPTRSTRSKRAADTSWPT